MILKKKIFLTIIDKTPLCSIDILIKINHKYLFGLRVNKPARNFYFVPGGRILKNEKYNTTIKRVLKRELGLRIKNLKYKIIGVFDHIYTNNFLNVKKINTHYFVCAIKIELNEKIKLTPDSQHKKLILLTKSQALNNKKIHKFCKIYLRNE